MADRHDAAGSNGGAPVKWQQRGGTNDYVTGKILVADASNLVGKVFVYYTPMA